MLSIKSIVILINTILSPDWSTRVKQIAKLWRKASSQDRAPYVVRALIILECTLSDDVKALLYSGVESNKTVSATTIYKLLTAKYSWDLKCVESKIF